MQTFMDTLSHATRYLTEWWAENKQVILESMETHKIVWVFGGGFIGFTALFLLGGAIVKNGIIFGLLLTAALVLLFTHKSKDGGAKKKKLLEFLGKHTTAVDVSLTVLCFATLAASGVTAGMALIVLGIFVSMLLHMVEEKQQKKG